MNRINRDLIVSLVATAVVAIVFASFELVEALFVFTRKYENWDLDEIIACIPAFAIVATWFSLRRWREVSELNANMKVLTNELAEALEQRKQMEEQLREGYRVAAMGTLGSGIASDLRSVFQSIKEIIQKESENAGLEPKCNFYISKFLNLRVEGKGSLIDCLPSAMAECVKLKVLFLPTVFRRVFHSPRIH